MEPKVNQLLNARAQDLEFELGTYLQLDQIKDIEGYDTSVVRNTLSEMQDQLMKKFDIDLETIAEEEEIEVAEVELSHINDALKTAKFESEAEMKVLITLDRFINQLKNVGAVEEELSGVISFKERLKKTVFDRYSITDEDLTEESSNE